MARGNRDVELIIRAKNEASKTLDAVTSALNQLTKSQSTFVQGANTTSSTLSRLGAELQKLLSQASGGSAFDKITSSVTKAAAGVARLESAITELTADQAKLTAEIAKGEATLTRYTADSARLAAELQKQKSATDGARANFNALTAEIGKGESEIKKRISSDQRLESSLAKQEAQLTRTQQRHRDLTQQLLAAETPSANLIASFTKIDTALGKQTTNLAKARTEYASNQTAIAGLNSSLESLRTQQAAANTALESAKNSQAQTANSLKTVSTAAKETGKSLVDLRASLEGNVQAQTRSTEAWQKARSELQQTQQAATQAGAAMDKIAATARGVLLRSLVDTQQALTKYRAEWQATTAAIAQGMANRAPGATLTPELQAMMDKARASKTAVQELQLAIQQMRTAVRDAGNDVVKLAAAEQTFQNALLRVKTATDASAASQQHLNNLLAGSGAQSNNAANGARNLSGALNQQSNAARDAAASMARLEAQGRSALSWAQRLRGEVVALATSYIGLFAAIQQLGGVVDAYRTIEAAQARLEVGFGSVAKAQRELRFIREEAQRLGIEIGTLAGEYSKFAIATKGSNLEGMETRRIFISVSEAARVNKLSLDQIRGTFNALTQMVSKGNVSMEELRQQLGERLYGSFTLAAQAMGMTGAELTKLISTGQLATDVFLPKFADQLDKTFGPALKNSLASLATEIGQFQNEIFKTQEAIGRGGFIAGFRDALKSLSDTLKQDETVAFFEQVGAAAGALVRVLAEIPNYTQPIIFVFSLLAASKLIGMLQAIPARVAPMVAAFRAVPPAAGAASTSVNAFAGVGGTYMTTAAGVTTWNARMAASFTALIAPMRAASGGFTATSVAAGLLTRALGLLRGALAAIGGLPGLIITGLAVAFTFWLTETGKATDAVDKHREQVMKVLDAYSLAKKGADDWAKSIQGVNLATAEKTGQDLAAQLKEQRDQLLAATSGHIENSIYTPQPFFSEGFGAPESGIRGLDALEKKVIELGRQVKDGQIPIKKYREELDNILKDPTVQTRLRDLIVKQSELAKQAEETERAVAENGLVIQTMGGNAGEAQVLIDQLGLSLEGMAKAAGLLNDAKPADPMALLQKQIDAVRSKIPSLADEMKRLEDLKALDEILKTANLIEGLDTASASYREFLSLVNQAKMDVQAAFDEKQFKEIAGAMTSLGNGVQMASALLKQFEGYRPTAYWDKDAFRAGFGSSTTTLEDGSVRKITEGMRVTLEDSNRDLARRIVEFQNVVKGQIGAERFNSFNPQQQAALTSLAYNYGSLEKRILPAVRTGTSEEIAAAIRSLRNDDSGINAKRRDQEAAIFQQGANFNPEGMAKLYEQQLKTAQDFHTQLNANLEVSRQQAEADKRQTLEQMTQIALSKAENDAAQAGTTLTAAQSSEIREQVRLKHAKLQAEWDETDAKKAQAELNRQEREGQERINTLMGLRRDIMSQMEFAKDRGDEAGYEGLKQQLLEVTTQTEAAIDAMTRFWQASGDPEKAAAAMAQLAVMKNSLYNVGRQGVLTFQEMQIAAGKAFGQQLLGGVNTFLEKIRETGDVIGAAKAAFASFAAEFLMQIAKMILQQALLNALKAAFGAFGVSTGAGSIGGAIVGGAGGVAHEGGVVGESIGSRPVMYSWFNNAKKYHGGGVAGLKSNEVPTILEEGETIRTVEQEAALTREMALAKAAGGSGGSGTPVTINNAIDAESLWASAAGSAGAEKAIMNVIRLNKSSVKSMIG